MYFFANVAIEQYMDKRLFLQLNGGRKIMGTLRGYDVFLNIVLDDVIEDRDDGERVSIGTVVVRGNSVGMMEALDKM